MKVGLISDTHGSLHPDVPAIFAGVDAIIHAGDVGSKSIIQKLEKIAPTTAIRGNCDTGIVAAFLEDVERLELAGHKLAVVHRPMQAKALVSNGFSGIIIFGHTHKPAHFTKEGVTYINPGSATNPRGVEDPSVAILTLLPGQAPKVELRILNKLKIENLTNGKLKMGNWKWWMLAFKKLGVRN